MPANRVEAGFLVIDGGHERFTATFYPDEIMAHGAARKLIENGGEGGRLPAPVYVVRATQFMPPPPQET